MPFDLRNYPITITVALLALLIHAIPSLTDWMQLDFDAVASGQGWRIWTGHLTHFDSSHLLWDLLMFVGLSGACERRRPGQLAPALAVMALGISLAVWLFCPDIAVYRGLSGIDTGLFVWFAGLRIQQSIDESDRLGAVLWMVPIAGLIGKLLYEVTTGQTLFVDSSQFTPLVKSHLAGVAIGILLCLYGRSVSITSVRYRLPSR